MRSITQAAMAAAQVCCNSVIQTACFFPLPHSPKELGEKQPEQAKMLFSFSLGLPWSFYHSISPSVHSLLKEKSLC